MSEFAIYQRKLLVFVLSFVCLCFILAILEPRYQDVFLGLVLGTLVSWVNAFYLAIKVNAITNAVLEGKGKRKGIGLITRVFFAIVAVFIAVKFPEQFNIYAVVCGLVVAQFSLLIIGIVVNKKSMRKG